MRYARFSAEGRTGWGQLEPTESGIRLFELEGDPFGTSLRSGWGAPIEAVRLRAPFEAAKIVGFGRNFERSEDWEPDDDRDPTFFLKPPSAVVDPGDRIVLPAGFERIVHEAELAVVIGDTCRSVMAEEADQVIFGYTCANDVSALGVKAVGGFPQMVMGKSFDTFCPMGPWIETVLDTSDVSIACRVNGELRQEGSSRGFRRDVGALIELASRVMTLHPGDIVLTGTPPGFAPLQDGDMVEVAIGGIGVLGNPVVGPVET